MIKPAHLEEVFRKRKNEIENAFKKITKKNARITDDKIHLLHDEVFSRIDCLSCANCCKTLGPLITDKDIDRIAKSLRQKPSDIVSQYLKIDEDGDYVFQTMPCPFLATDNYCLIYDNRPKACREYPHTDRKNFYQLTKLTLKNCTTCPAVYEIADMFSRG